jgi:hypothetical protein
MTLLSPTVVKEENPVTPTPTPSVTVHRQRVSVVAPLSLMLSVVAACAVATGSLAGVGAIVGLVAAILAIVGIVTTSRVFVSGKPDAVLGVLLGLAAAVVGALAMTGRLSWLDPSTNEATRLHDWLAMHVSWLTRVVR